MLQNLLDRPWARVGAGSLQVGTRQFSAVATMPGRGVHRRRTLNGHKKKITGFITDGFWWIDYIPVPCFLFRMKSVGLVPWADLSESLVTSVTQSENRSSVERKSDMSPSIPLIGNSAFRAGCGGNTCNPSTRLLRQEDWEFETSLGRMGHSRPTWETTSSQINKQTKNKQTKALWFFPL